MHEIESKVIRKAIRAMKAAGDPIVEVFDGEETIKVTGEKDILGVVASVDMSGMYSKSGAWIGVILGNLQDCIYDYSVSLEDILNPVYEYAAQFD